MKSIHDGIKSIIEPENISKTIVEETNSTTTFEDRLQGIGTAFRPRSLEHVKVIGQKLVSTVIAAGEDAQKWKLLMLTVLDKRYHMKSPEAQSIKQKKKQDEKVDQKSSGEGERLSFYILFICLHYLSVTKDGMIPPFINDLSAKACQCLGRLATAAGGTRDVCTLLEHLVYENLLRNGAISIQKESGNKRGICAAVIEYILSKKHTPDSIVLNEFVKTIADLVDRDFSLITSAESNKSKDDKGLQSTINTFIPHHNRGTNERRLAQSVAELMIWSETKHSQTDSKFVQAAEDICSSTSSIVSSDSTSDDKIVASLHSIQTSIRRFRKQLNNSSRSQGFSLHSTYSMDPSSITLSMVKRGRQGDVLCLEKSAKRKVDKRVMALISNRYADPSKAIPLRSTRELCNSWVALESATKSNDELTALQLKIQEATVRATVKLLNSQMPKANSQKDVMLASLDGKIENDITAVLVAAAIDANCQWDDNSDNKEQVDHEKREVTLFIGDKEYKTFTPAEVLSLLDTICAKKNNSPEETTTPATTKDVQNIIERHLRPNSNLFLFSSTDIQLEQQVLTNLQLDGCTIHCHINNDFQYRMKREKAKVGDMTITLVWDNECDLDLHCHCPNGDRISYGKKEGGGDIGGGYLDVDMNVNGESKEPVENIFFGDAEKGIQAAKGKYKVIVNNYRYHGKTVKCGDPVPWRLRVLKNGETLNYSGECKGAGESSNVIAVEFEYEGRKAPPPDEVGSALTSSNLVSVTSSTGDTIDSLSGLLSVFEEHAELTDVQNLVNNEAAPETTSTSPSPPGDNNVTPSRPLMADSKSFDVTNRDRLYLKLSKLPKLFHLHVNQSFGENVSLMEYTASELARRLISDAIPIEELREAGYQEDIVAIIKEKMLTFGI